MLPRKILPLFLLLLWSLPSQAVVSKYLICLGDSITKTTGITGDEPPNWPDRVSVSGLTLTMQNEAVGATRIADAVAKVSSVVNPADPDLVICETGTNDLALDNVSLQTLKDRYTTLLTALRDREAWYCTMLPRSYGPTNEATRLAFNAWLLATPDIKVIDIASAMTDPNDSNDILPAYTFDGTHPSAAGKEVIAGLIETALAERYMTNCASIPVGSVYILGVVIGVVGAWRARRRR